MTATATVICGSARWIGDGARRMFFGRPLAGRPGFVRAEADPEAGAVFRALRPRRINGSVNFGIFKFVLLNRR